MDMSQIIILPIFKGEQTRPTYYLLTDIIYVLVIHVGSNNTRFVYNWTEFEVNKGMKNISSLFLHLLN